MFYELPEFKKFSLKKYYSADSKVTKVIHPGWPILTSHAPDNLLKELIMLLEKSLSLDLGEKLRVLNSHMLSMYQVDALIDVFREERFEFEALMKEEKHAIYELVQTSLLDWNGILLPRLILGPHMDISSAGISDSSSERTQKSSR